MAESRFKKYREEAGKSSQQAKPARETGPSSLGTFIVLFLLAGVVGVWGYYFMSKPPSGAADKFSANPVLKVTFFDVGQGDAALILAPSGAAVLMDAGGRPGYVSGENELAQEEKNDYTTEAIIPELKKELKFSATDQVPAFVDYFIATHPHPDHYGGFVTLMENNILPKKVLLCGSEKTYSLYSDFLAAVRKEKLKAENVQPGRVIDLGDGITLKFLGPLVRYGGTGSDDNNSSLVAKLSYRNVSVLFAGDIELAAENDLINWRGLLRSTVLKVANHGSGNSTSSPFLDAAAPAYAVISSGLSNSYGYPHESVIKKLADRNVKIFRTDRNGSVTLSTDGKSIKMASQR